MTDRGAHLEDTGSSLRDALVLLGNYFNDADENFGDRIQQGEEKDVTPKISNPGTKFYC